MTASNSQIIQPGANLQPHQVKIPQPIFGVDIVRKIKKSTLASRIYSYSLLNIVQNCCFVTQQIRIPQSNKE